MKKSIIISAIALCFSVVSVNATSSNSIIEDYKVETAYKVNSFCVSIAKGDIETVKKLIDRGADINEKSNGMTPVMYAAKFNRTEILNLLISKGAKLKVKSQKGMTALKYAEIHGAKDAAVILKEATSKKKK
ncbi:ankyrin repeat domain-containing protein [uncultured Algibacter sp.]|uniref:ankyrin repeat domain-containing protein n=1 Tax=uncultured Algibacter sp. TaxID=298659 RepID=UPI003217D187